MKNSDLTTNDILVVDDNPADLTILRTILTNRGYHVRAAINGEMALTSVSKKAPDLILSDIKMPGMNGYQLCERLKADPDPGIGNIPLIFISALDEVVDRVTALSCGGVDFIAKPFEQEEVLARIETHLKLRQTQKELEEKNVLLHQEISQREQAQHSLQESQRALATLMSNLPGMAYRCFNDSNWTMLFVSEGCLALTGYQTNELMNNQVIGYGQLIHPDDQQMVWETVQTAVQDNKPFTITYRILTRDGEEKWVWEQGLAVTNSENDSPMLEGFITDITQQIQAEKRLQESETKWRTFVKNVPDTIFTVNRKGQITFINRVPEGLTAATAIGTSVYDYVAPEQRNTVRELIQGVFRTGTPDSYEGSARGSDDSIAWYSTVLGPIEEEGEVTAVILITRDISNRKSMEAALHDSVSRFRSLVEQSPFSTALYTPDGYLVYGNPASAKLFNIAPENLLKLYHTYNVLADQQLVEQGQMPYIQKGFAGEYSEIPPAKHALGRSNPALADRSRWLQSFIYPVKNEDGEIKEVVLIHDDITEQVETSAKIRQSEERYRAVVETANDGIITFDEQGDVVSWNRGAAIIFGYTADEINGRSITTIMPEGFRESHQNSLAQVAATKKSKMSSKTVEHTGRRKDGSEFPLELSLAKWEADDETFFTSIIRDITKRVDDEAQLRESQQQLKLLVDNIVDAVWQTDLKLNFTYISPSVFPLTGYTQEEWIGTNLSQHATGKEFFKMARKALKAIKNYKENQHISFEANLFKKNGEIYPVEIISKLIFNQNGFPIGLQGTTRDITQRKQIEEYLRRSESHLSAIFNNTSDLQALSELEPDGVFRVVAINKKYIETVLSFGLNVPEEGFVGTPLDEAILLMGLSQEVSDYNIKNYQEVITTGEPMKYDETLDLEAGPYHSEISLIPVPDQHGRNKYVLFTAHNITDRKRAEEELRQSESRLSVVFNNASDLQLLWAVNPNGEFRVIAANKSYYEVMRGFGIDLYEENVIGKTMHELNSFLGLDQVIQDNAVKNYQKAVRYKEPIKYSISLNVGVGIFHAEITLIPVVDQNGNCQFVLYNSHNVTELKKTADDLKKLNSELDERVRERTADLNKMVQLMAGREVRMAELKQVIKQLRKQMQDAGMQPVANDPLASNQD